MTQSPQGPGDDDRWIDRILDEMADMPDGQVPDALMSRVLADADAMLPPPGGRVARAPWWRQFVEGLGGWIAVGGLAAAAATGFAVGLGGLDSIGVSVPWSLDYESYYDGTGAFDAFGWDMEEG